MPLRITRKTSFLPQPQHRKHRQQLKNIMYMEEREQA